MIYRLDQLIENGINPITNCEYDSSWVALVLDNSQDHRICVGSKKGCAYTIRMSRVLCDDWKFRVGDFIEYNKICNKNGILVMSKEDYKEALDFYKYHSYNEPLLRAGELEVLVHSTTMECWNSIQHDGCLKCWNFLKKEKIIDEDEPIGLQLGDPADFSDYIMFGRGVTTEVVVSSKLSVTITMDMDEKYTTGARLYFDAKRIASDGLLIRDGCHIKVKGSLPLEPYLIWAATWDKIGLPSQISTPKIFSETSDKYFKLFQNSSVGT